MLDKALDQPDSNKGFLSQTAFLKPIPEENIHRGFGPTPESPSPEQVRDYAWLKTHMEKAWYAGRDLNNLQNFEAWWADYVYRS